MTSPTFPGVGGHRVFATTGCGRTDLANLHHNDHPVHPHADLADLDNLSALARQALKYESKAVFLGNARADAIECEYWIAALEQRYGVKFYFTG
jgi:hypothetical protein